MWNRLAGTGSELREKSRSAGSRRVAPDAPPRAIAASRGADRRAYYRVEGMLPVRVTPLAPHEVEAAIFDLSIPDPLLQPVGEDEGDSPMAARLRRIEEKLDLLLGAMPGDRPQPLSGRDRKPVVFSGAGLRLEVDCTYRAGDAFRVEVLLPPPYLRTLRAVGYAVDSGLGEAGAVQSLALALRHMEDEERDALVAYSYDLQRFALRHRAGEV